MVGARWSKLGWCSAALALLVGACGGKSAGGASNAGGTSNAGSATNPGGASNAGGAGSSGAPSTGCPAQQPKQGDACRSPANMSCSYAIDECKSVTFDCMGSVWVEESQPDGAAYDCSSFPPPNAPKDGDSCKCLGVLDCSYADCSGRGQIHAVCDNSTWHVTETACSKQPCGQDGMRCDWPSSVCVIQTGPMPTFECMKNPCAPGTVSCDCAAALCKVGRCEIDTGTVACICPTC